MKDNKTNTVFTLIVIAIFLILSYSIVKSFFGDDSNNGKTFSKNGSFRFILDDKELSDKNLKAMYDENRTNKVVMDKNYIKATGDENKGKLFLNPNSIEYYFTNAPENGTYYKLTIKDANVLNLYRLNDKDLYMHFAVLGSDLKYYSMTISINEVTDDMDKDDKEWKRMGSINMSVQTNAYYKLIDDKCCIQIIFPTVYDESKFLDDSYNKLVKKVEDSISIEEIKDFEYNYYKFDVNNIKLSDKATLLTKDGKLFQYYPKSNDSYSYTTVTFITKDKAVSVSEIDNADNYKLYQQNNGYTMKEYDYNGIETYLITHDGTNIESFVFNIDNTYYEIKSLVAGDTCREDTVNDYITRLIDGVIRIN